MSKQSRRVPERLTHEYFRVDAAVVWDTIKNDLPKLEALINSLSDKIRAP
jgi:uncharacterized protein with HEPN domain